ncbi:MAG: hypothetical protein WAV41_05220 [Microgenomates group bacterium]
MNSTPAVTTDAATVQTNQIVFGTETIKYSVGGHNLVSVNVNDLAKGAKFSWEYYLSTHVAIVVNVDGEQYVYVLSQSGFEFDKFRVPPEFGTVKSISSLDVFDYSKLSVSFETDLGSYEYVRHGPDTTINKLSK